MNKTLFVINDAILLSVFKSWVFRSQKKDNLFFAKNGKEAMEIMQSNQIDLFISELNLSEIDGLELLAGFSFYYPALKVVILVPKLSDELEKNLAGLSSFHFLKKPEALKDFISLINLLDVADFQATTLSEMAVADFLGLVELHKKTCLLAIETDQPLKKGIVYFDQGVLSDAVCDDLKAEFAVIEMLGWKHVKVTFKPLEKKKFRKQIQSSLQTLVIEGNKAKAEIEADILESKTKKIDEQPINLQETASAEMAAKEAEAKAKADAEAKSKAAAEALAKAEAKAKQKAEADAKAKAEAEKKAKAAAETKTKAKAEADAKAKAAAEAEKKAKAEADAKIKAMAARISKLELAQILKPLQEMDDYLASAIFDMTGRVLEKHNISNHSIEAIGENAVTAIKSAIETINNIGLGTANFIQINSNDCIFEAVWILENQFISAVLLKPAAKNTGLAKMSLIKVCEAIHSQLI